MSDKPGIAFEKVVAEIQAQIDPASAVTHNEKIRDRLGHDRQFDVVIRGSFGGQKMLGVIECKDLNKKVGTPEVDAFVTKSQDINANFKVLMSRRGFSEPARQKCAHYGVHALSLVDKDPITQRFFVGTRWEADIERWAQIRVRLHFQTEPIIPVNFNAENLKISGKPVLDWFKNYLLDQQHRVSGFGWVVDIAVVFDVPQRVDIDAQRSHTCTAISFAAERILDKRERLVGISGTGFYDWNSKEATFPPNTQIRSDVVSLDFSKWTPRNDAERPASGLIDIRIEVFDLQFERTEGAIELDRL